MTTKFGIPTDEYEQLVQRAKRFYEDELIDQLIDNHKGDMVAIDGRTLQYEVAMNESSARQELERKCGKPVVYLVRIGFDYHYDVPLPSTVLSGSVE